MSAWTYRRLMGVVAGVVLVVGVVAGQAWQRQHVTTMRTGHSVDLTAPCRREQYDNGSTDAICYSVDNAMVDQPIATWPLVRCYTLDMDHKLNAAATLQRQGHHVAYVDGRWYVDYNAGPATPTEDSPTMLCEAYPHVA